jgi:hypothetical protein
MRRLRVPLAVVAFLASAASAPGTRTDAMRPVRLRQARDSDLRIVAAYFTN